MFDNLQKHIVVLRQVWTAHERPINFEPVVSDMNGKDVSGFERHSGKGKDYYKKEEILRELRAAIELVEKMPEISIPQTEVDKLPPIGSKVWAIKHRSKSEREALHVKVDGHDVRDGALVLVVEFYWVPAKEAFKTKEEAEKYLSTYSKTV